jgi:hypothetical protein
MLAQNTWARRGLYILVSLIVLAGVAVAAYGLGANNAADGPRAGFIERGPIGDGPQGNRDGGPGQAGPGNQDGQGAPGFGPRFTALSRLAGRPGIGGFGLILRAMLAILFVGLLALGAVAFFRTGGWQPQPQAAAVEARAGSSKSAKQS